jgi:hypothetical protein
MRDCRDWRAIAAMGTYRRDLHRSYPMSAAPDDFERMAREWAEVSFAECKDVCCGCLTDYRAGWAAGAKAIAEMAAQEMDSFDKNGANANCWMRGTLMKRIRQLAGGESEGRGG